MTFNINDWVYLGHFDSKGIDLRLLDMALISPPTGRAWIYPKTERSVLGYTTVENIDFGDMKNEAWLYRKSQIDMQRSKIYNYL